MENIFVEFLPPWIETGLQPAFYDKESGTVLQQTARMYARVNMLIRMFNKLSKNTKTTVEDYINQFNELHDYVHDYFDNLDVQEEINNKLDEMAESGELEQIIAQYLTLATLFCYDTASDLAGAENLTEGCSAYILGKDTYNDGKGAFYKIRELRNTDIPDGDNIITLTETSNLIAEKLPNYAINQINNVSIPNLQGQIDTVNNTTIPAVNERIDLLDCLNPYYDEITYSYNRANNTNYYLTNIPFQDSEGSEIPFELIAAGENTSTLDKSHIENSNFTCNGSLAVNNGTTYVNGNVIINGEIVNNNDVSAYCTNEKYMGIKADRTIAIYDNDTTAQAMVDDGVLFGCLIFGKCATNGLIDPNFTFQTVKGPDIFIGQKLNKDLVIIATDGRNSNNQGMVYTQACQILIDNGCADVYALDGGGSTSMVFKGNKLNMNVDDKGVKDRKITYLFNVTKKPVINRLTDIYNMIGSMKHLLNYQLRPLINNSEPIHRATRVRTNGNWTPTSSNEIIPLVQSAPYSPSYIVKTEDANGGSHFALPSGNGYVKVGGMLVIQPSSSTSIYAGCKINGVEINNIGATTEANGVYSLTLNDFFYVNEQTNDLTFFARNGKVLRSWFYIEWFPINTETYNG